MRKFLVLAVSLLVLLAAYLWFAPHQDNLDRQPDREFTPDYIAENLTLRIYDKEGYIADHLQLRSVRYAKVSNVPASKQSHTETTASIG